MSKPHKKERTARTAHSEAPPLPETSPLPETPLPNPEPLNPSPLAQTIAIPALASTASTPYDPPPAAPSSAPSTPEPSGTPTVAMPPPSTANASREDDADDMNDAADIADALDVFEGAHDDIGRKLDALTSELAIRHEWHTFLDVVESVERHATHTHGLSGDRDLLNDLAAFMRLWAGLPARLTP